MKSGSVIVKIIIVIIAIVVGILAVLYVDGYFSVWSSNLKVDKVIVNVSVDSSGIAHIHESDYYTFVKPYHGFAPYTQFPSGLSMSNFKLSVEGATIQKTQGYVNKNGFDLLVYLNNGYTVPKPGGDKVLMNLSYDVAGGFQVGQNFSQFFYKFWGKGTPSWVPLLTVNYTFPSTFDVQKIFVHPLDVPHQIIMNGKNAFTIIYHDIPPNTYAEARVVFPLIQTVYTSPISMDLRTVQDMEQGYSNGVTEWWIWIILLVILIPTVPLVFKSFFGTEPKVDVAEYEREIPYDDPPELVNSIVKRLITEPDADGFAAAILNLVDKGYLGFSGNDAFKISEGKKPLSESEKILFNDVIKPFSVDGIFEPKSIGESLRSNAQKARKFNEAFTKWKFNVSTQAEARNYLLTYGNTITKLVAFLALIVLPLTLLFILQGEVYPNILLFLSWVSFADWTSAWVIFVLPRDVFGRWTKEGRTYYLRWKRFEKYITDYSLIKEKPPESILIWKQYLVYGTALGVAKHVIKVIKEVNPPVVEEDPFFPAFTAMVWYDSLIFLPQAALFEVNTQQVGNVGGNFGGGFGGNVGGGFGGGGRGGF